MKTLLFILSGSVLLLLPTPEDIPHVKGDTVTVVASRDTTEKISDIDMFDIDSSFLTDSSKILRKAK